MKLYHGTNEDYFPQIMVKGLQPRGKRKSHWEQYPSRNDMVYLTVAYPFYFALNTKGMGRPIVLEIESEELNEELLHPDEDFVVQSLAKKPKHIEKIHNDIKNNLESYQQHWQLSIENLGNCCYKGNIHKAAIKRVCLFNPKARPTIATMVLDPTISLMNYQFMHAKYTSLVAWMFGDIAELPQEAGIEHCLTRDLSDADPGLIAQIKGIKKQYAQRKQESKDITGIVVALIQNGKIMAKAEKKPRLSADSKKRTVVPKGKIVAKKKNTSSKGSQKRKTAVEKHLP